MAAVTWRFSLLTLFGVVAVVAVACAALTNPTPLWTCVVETGVLATLTYGVVAAVFRRESRRAFWIGLSIVGWGYALLVTGHKVLDNSMSWSGYGNSGFATGQSYLATTRLVLWWAEKREGSPWAAPQVAYSTPSYTVPTLAPSAYYGPYSTYPDASSGPQDPTLAPPTVIESESQPGTFSGNEVTPSTAPSAGPPQVTSAPAPVTAISTIAAYDPERYLRLIRIGEFLWALVLGIVGGFVARWMYANRHTIPVGRT